MRASSRRLTLAASGNVERVTSVLNGPPALNNALASMGSIPVSYAIAMHLTTPFTPQVDCACANFTATITTTPGDAGVAQTNFDALFDEAERRHRDDLYLRRDQRVERRDRRERESLRGAPDAADDRRARGGWRRRG